MDISGFIGFTLIAALVIVLSMGLDRLFARIVPLRFLYYAIRMPGVVLHELAHVLGCLLAGAKIKRIVLFSDRGGSVAYAEPRIPLLGNVIISTAPLFILPLVLAGLTWVFGTFLGCSFPLVVPPRVDTAAGVRDMVVTTTGIFTANLFTKFNGWFLFYLYLTASIVLSLSPGGQDLKNAATGIGALAALCLLVIWSGSAPAIALLSLIISPMSTAFSLGLTYEMIAAVVSVPFIILYWIQTR